MYFTICFIIIYNESFLTIKNHCDGVTITISAGGWNSDIRSNEIKFQGVQNSCDPTFKP